MKDYSLPRVLLVLLSAAVFVVVLVMNALAGAAKGEFVCWFGSLLTLFSVYETTRSRGGFWESY